MIGSAAAVAAVLVAALWWNQSTADVGRAGGTGGVPTTTQAPTPGDGVVAPPAGQPGDAGDVQQPGAPPQRADTGRDDVQTPPTTSTATTDAPPPEETGTIAPTPPDPGTPPPDPATPTNPETLPDPESQLGPEAPPQQGEASVEVAPQPATQSGA